GGFRQEAGRAGGEGRRRLRLRALSRCARGPAHLVRRHRGSSRRCAADAVDRLGVRRGQVDAREGGVGSLIPSSSWPGLTRPSIKQDGAPTQKAAYAGGGDGIKCIVQQRNAPMSKPKVLISDALSPAAVQIFKDRGVEVDFQPNLGKDKDKLAEIIGEYDGLAIRSATKATAKIIEKASKLKVIGRAGI